MAERNLQIIDHQDRPIASAQPGPRLGLPTPSELEALKAYSQMAIASGMIPKHIDKWETAATIMRYGHQLGVDEYTALNNMYVIGGKPSMMASLMHALMLRDHGDDAIHVRVSNGQRCELVCKRRNASQASLVTYTIEEANAAGLPTSNAVWKKYPADMLFARAISRAGRQIFRDSTMGMYVPEELGGDVIEAHGEIIETTGRQSDNVRELRPGYEAVLSDRPVPPPGAASEEQFKEIARLAKAKGFKTRAEIQNEVGKPVQTLTPEEAAALIGQWEADLTPMGAEDMDVIETTGTDMFGDSATGTAGTDRYTS